MVFTFLLQFLRAAATRFQETPGRAGCMQETSHGRSMNRLLKTVQISWCLQFSRITNTCPRSEEPSAAKLKWIALCKTYIAAPQLLKIECSKKHGFHISFAVPSGCGHPFSRDACKSRVHAGNQPWAVHKQAFENSLNKLLQSKVECLW